MSTTSTDPLEGVTQHSLKADLWKKLNELADRVRSAEAKAGKEHAGKVGRLAAEIRAKGQGGTPHKLHNIIVSATVDEMNELHEFFSDFSDLHDALPAPVQRLIVGVDVMLGKTPSGDGSTPTP